MLETVVLLNIFWENSYNIVYNIYNLWNLWKLLNSWKNDVYACLFFVFHGVIYGEMNGIQLAFEHNKSPSLVFHWVKSHRFCKCTGKGWSDWWVCEAACCCTCPALCVAVCGIRAVSQKHARGLQMPETHWQLERRAPARIQPLHVML